MCYDLSWADKKVIESFKEHTKKECIYCGKKLIDTKDITVDHLTPVSRKGRTHKENLGMCCYDCNQEKLDMTYNEYIQYLDIKENELNNNRVWFKLDLAIKSLQEISNVYNNAIEKIPKLKEEKKELEKIIKDPSIKVNAAQGFMLFKNLRDVLIELEESENTQKVTEKIIITIKENMKQLKIKKEDLENKIMRKVRNECNIGQIAKLNIRSIDFSKWTRCTRIHKII